MLTFIVIIASITALIAHVSGFGHVVGDFGTVIVGVFLLYGFFAILFEKVIEGSILTIVNTISLILINNWSLSVAGIVACGYIVVGLIYSIIRWNVYVRSDEAKRIILSAYRLFENSGSSSDFKTSMYYPFRVNKNYKQISYYVILWPFSILRDIFSVALLNAISTYIYNTLRAIGNSVSGVYGMMADRRVDEVISNAKTEK